MMCKRVLCFKCGNQNAKLTVFQYGIIETSYVDLKLEDKDTSIEFNEQTGEAVIEFKGGTIPNVEKGQAFVLPDTYNYGIRIITEKNINGNKIELKTQKGNMCDLFKDIDFTLTSNQDAVQGEPRSTGHRIYTPAKIIAHTKTGKVVIYDNRTAVRNVEVTIKNPIFEFGKNIHALASYYLRGENIDRMETSLTEKETAVWQYLKSIKYFSFSVINTEYNLSVKIGNHFFGGRLDALVKNENKYYILDYKTGNAPKNAAYEFQTMIYMLAVKEFFKTSDVTFVYLYLKNNTEVAIELTPELEKEYIKKLEDTANKIESRNFHKIGSNCKCEYSIMCY